MTGCIAINRIASGEWLKPEKDNTLIMSESSIVELLDGVLAARELLFDARHESAFRLFNGFTEGYPDLVVDLYAATLVIQNYADRPADGEATVSTAQEYLLNRLPWLRAVIVKTRNAPTAEGKRGRITFGEKADTRIREHGIWYALDLMMNRDASLYLDTRNLRKWAIENLAGKAVLNTFAYTGSLGVAATAGGAARVVQLDLNRQFLNVAKTSYTLNGFPINKKDFITGDFWPQVSRFKRIGEHFDCVFIDAPFFSTTSKGVVDLQTNSARLINKVRPLINDGGFLVAINNALFLSGKDYLDGLEALCADGYLSISELIPVPADFTGQTETCVGVPVSDPAPFNHSTKIAVLTVRRKA
jgi:23S rRNA (cytosine1962-C5)-methyltransferase